jgi:hypothetical protein
LARLHISSLIVDEQVRPLQLPQEFIEYLQLLSLFELADQLTACEEAHLKALLGSGLPQGNAYVRFPSAFTADQATTADYARIALLCNSFASG